MNRPAHILLVEDNRMDVELTTDAFRERSDARMSQPGIARPDALVTLTSDGLIVEWEADAHALFGWPAEAARGRRAAALLADADTGAVLARHIASAARAVDGRLRGCLVPLTLCTAGGGDLSVAVRCERSGLLHDTVLLLVYANDRASTATDALDPPWADRSR